MILLSIQVSIHVQNKKHSQLWYDGHEPNDPRCLDKRVFGLIRTKLNAQLLVRVDCVFEGSHLLKWCSTEIYLLMF